MQFDHKTTMVASNNYTVLAPSTPESPAAGASGSQFRFDEKRNVTIPESDFDSDNADDLRGRTIVAKFGDRNCGITHYFDFEKEHDDFQRIITNAKYYLQQAGNQFKSVLDTPEQWIGIIWKNWSQIGMPEIVQTKWDQITFVVFNSIVKYNCRGCLYQECYLTNFGESEGVVPQHRFKKLLQETLDKMNVDVSEKNLASKLIIKEALTKL